MEKSIVMLGEKQVRKILEGKEREIVEMVEETYLAHDRGMSVLPHSSFLRFPDDEKNRMIALPAYLGGERPMAGVKWISSFPENIEKGMERASAVMILNDMESGRVKAILEGSQISATRTAASAVLAAKYLHSNAGDERLGLIGCGRINSEILKFFCAVFKMVRTIYLYDRDPERAEKFSKTQQYEKLKFVCCESVEEVFECTSVVSVATTASIPFIGRLPENMTILDISLRDFKPEVIKSAHNIVDDADHVCREKTSIELTYGQEGSKNFIAGTLAEVIRQKVAARQKGKSTIFSPFGLGILDLIVADYIYEQAMKKKIGWEIPEFLP